MAIVAAKPLTINEAVYDSAGSPTPKKLRPLPVAFIPLIILSAVCALAIILELFWLWLMTMVGLATLMLLSFVNLIETKKPHLRSEARLHALMHIDNAGKFNEIVDAWNYLAAKNYPSVALTEGAAEELKRARTVLDRQGANWINDPDSHSDVSWLMDLYLLGERIRKLATSEGYPR